MTKRSYRMDISVQANITKRSPDTTGREHRHRQRHTRCSGVCHPCLKPCIV